MFFTKLALYGTIAGTFFAVSAFSTVQITKQMNKTPVPNDIEEDEDDDITLPARQMSDTEQFINNISAFGNMEANLNLNITKGNYNVSINGDVFVSMETMEDIQFEAKLNIDALDHEFYIEATYVNNTVYASFENNNVKLETSSLSDVMTLFSNIGPEIELPESFKNIDSNQLVANLAAMTSEKQEDKIVYTCNLIDGIPPVIFVTDLNYNMTSLSISGVDIAGFRIDANATTNILGKGQNRISINDSLYTDLTSDVNTMKAGLANQVRNIVNNGQIGISNYNIEVYKRKSEIINEEEVITNELVFNMDGNANISIPNTKNIATAKVSLEGHMSNPNEGKNLDSNVDIKLYDGAVYFDYTNKANEDLNLKLKYAVSDISDLIEIIKKKITNNASDDISDVLDKVFPSKSDTTKSPIVDIVKSKNYAAILDYYRSTTINPDTHEVSINIDGALIGNDEANIVVSLATGNKGINNITVNNVYALGYLLNLSVDLSDYSNFSMTTEEKDLYTDLGYINNVFDKIATLVDKDEFAISLSGSLDLGKGKMDISGNSYVSLSTNKDFGVAELNISKDNKNHNIKINVDRNKVAKNATAEEKDNALRTSEVLFSYNDNLKGSLNLKSLTETFDLVKKLASDGNALLDKIKGLLTRDSTQSTLNKIMNGEPEAIMYDNSLETITYKTDGEGYCYDIQISGNLLKSDTNDLADPIHIYINLDKNNEFTGIGIKGKLNSYTLDIDLGISEATSGNPFSWQKLTKDSSYYDFSEIKTLTEYLFNTGEKRDFIINGNLAINIIGDINIPMNASIKVEKSNTGHDDVYAKVEIGYFKDLEGVSIVNPFAQRKFTMYIIQTESKDGNNQIVKNEMVHIDVEHKLSLRSDKSVTLTMEEFNEKPVYWICNYGLGLGIDNTDSSTSSNIDYSRLISSFTYNSKTNPEWVIGVDLSQLVSMLNTANVTITGDASNKTLSGINVTTSISLIDISLNATLDVKTGINNSFKTTVANKMN